MRVSCHAHHDGSALYVAPGAIALGDDVTVRVRVPRGSPHDTVWLRSVADGEPRIVPCAPTETTDIDRWYEGQLRVANPVTRYRFAFGDPGGRGLVWLNAAGVWSYDVPDAFDFRLTLFAGAPDWAVDGVVYQIFPDRFARSPGAHVRETPSWAEPMEWGAEPAAHGARPGRQLYGGDLAGIEEHLDDLQRLGVTALYLTPFFPAGSAHRYDAASFEHVDLLLGGDEALASLTAAVHMRGMRIVGDLTTNHTGRSHEWFERAERGDRSPEADYYLWHSYPDDPVTWLDTWTLPKLNWASEELRERFTGGADSVVGRWLNPPFNLDGWRIDVANMTGRYGEQDLTGDVARKIRRTMATVKPDAVLVAEHMFDASADLAGNGWHATMNYAGFTFPIWTWLCDPANETSFQGLPVPVPRRSGIEVVRAMREFAAQVPWQVAAAQWNILGSHDTVRLRTLLGSRDREQVAVALLMTYLGAPMVYAGDEWGLEGTTGEHGRVAMPWDEPERRDEATWEVFHDLIALRREHPALRHGSLRWVLVEDDAIGYVREDATESLLVIAARDAWPGARLPRLVAGELDGSRLFGQGRGRLVADEAGIAIGGSDGPGAWVWRLR